MRNKDVLFPVDIQNGAIHLARTNADDVSGAPFLFAPHFAPRAGKALPVASVPRGRGGPRYIFHTAFCCSTLLAKAMDVPGKCLALKEPDILMKLSNAQRMSSPDGRAECVEAVGAALFNTGEDLSEAVVVKPTNAANRLISDQISDPSSRGIVIHSDLESFLLSIVRKGEEGRIFVRRLFNIFRMDSAFAQSLPDRDLFTLSDLQIAALVWVIQCDQVNQTDAAKPGRLRSLHCDEFLDDPASVLDKVNAWLKTGLSAEDIDRQVNGPVFKSNSKDASEAYDTSIRSEERADAADKWATSIQFTQNWASKLPLAQQISVPKL